MLEELFREIIPNCHPHKANQNTKLEESKLPMPDISEQRRESLFVSKFYTVFPSLISLQCREGRVCLNHQLNKL